MRKLGYSLVVVSTLSIVFSGCAGDIGELLNKNNKGALLNKSNNSGKHKHKVTIADVVTSAKKKAEKVKLPAERGRHNRTATKLNKEICKQTGKEYNYYFKQFRGNYEYNTYEMRCKRAVRAVLKNRIKTAKTAKIANKRVERRAKEKLWASAGINNEELNNWEKAGCKLEDAKKWITLAQWNNTERWISSINIKHNKFRGMTYEQMKIKVAKEEAENTKEKKKEKIAAEKEKIAAEKARIAAEKARIAFEKAAKIKKGKQYLCTDGYDSWVLKYNGYQITFGDIDYIQTFGGGYVRNKYRKTWEIMIDRTSGTMTHSGNKLTCKPR